MKKYLISFFTIFTAFAASAQITLLKDINPGAANGLQSGFYTGGCFNNFNGFTIFQATEPTTGGELWKTNGVETGTTIVQDMVAGTVGCGSMPFVQMGNQIFFKGYDPINNTELWKSDGSGAGAAMVKNIGPGSGSFASGLTGNPYLYAFQNHVYFMANDGVHGTELWISDGTEAGTFMLKDFNVGNEFSSSFIYEYVEFNGVLYFNAENRLWKTDGTEAGTVMVSSVPIGGGIIAFNGSLYLGAGYGFDQELWKSDGTGAGTVLFKNINPSATSGSTPTDFTISGNTLFFTANDGSHGAELWKTDGTEIGTLLVKDINPGSGTGAGSSGGSYNTLKSTNKIIDAAGVLFFPGSDGVNGSELWKSDGTEAGTVMVKNIRNPGGSSPASFATKFGLVFFRADNGINGIELWRSDGTEVGTVLVQDLITGITGSAPNNLYISGNRLYMTANTAATGVEVFVLPICPPAINTMLLPEVPNVYQSTHIIPEGTTLHFCDCANNLLLLSIDPMGSAATFASNSVQLKIGVGATYYPNGTGFVTNPLGTAFFNREWNVSPIVQPDNPVKVRSYYLQQDFNNVNTALANQGQAPLSAETQMYFYKVTNAALGAFPAVSTIMPADVIQIYNGAAPAISSWLYGNIGIKKYSEFLVTSFSGGGGGGSSPGIVLPLNLISFTGSKQSNNALLQWKTANERGVSKFEIQRSDNGQNFTTLGTVAAGSSSYLFTDVNIFSSKTLAFYRLKSIDVDGRFTYSSIIKLSNQSFNTLLVSPNPVRDVLTINGLKQIGKLLLFNAEGKLLQQQTVTAQTITMDMSKYAKGIYLLQYKTGDEVVNQKIIKQ